MGKKEKLIYLRASSYSHLPGEGKEGMTVLWLSMEEGKKVDSS